VAQSTLSPELGFMPHVSSLAARLTAAAAVFRSVRWLPWFVLTHGGMDGAASSLVLMVVDGDGVKRAICGGVAMLFPV